MLYKWSPASKLSDIRLPHIPNGWYISSLVQEPTYSAYLLKLLFDIFKSFPVFVIIEFLLLDIMSTLPI